MTQHLKVTNGTWTGPPYTYRWMRSDDGGDTWENIPGETGPSHTTPTPEPAEDRRRVLGLEPARGILIAFAIAIPIWILILLLVLK